MRLIGFSRTTEFEILHQFIVILGFNALSLLKFYCAYVFHSILQVNKRKPYHSVNFVIAHDGFTLYDLVSYNLKVRSNFKIRQFTFYLILLHAYSIGSFGFVAQQC